MRTALLLAWTALALSGCSLAPTVPTRAVYDLGASTAPVAPAGPLAWRVADVTAAPALDGDGIAYRLAFQQAQRLERYRDSVWAAPPAALLTPRLRAQLGVVTGCAGAPAGLLAVHLDEFEQVFDSPQRSRVVLRIQATRWPAGGGVAVQQQWRLERAAESPDAASAVTGLAALVEAWVPQAASWLTEVGCR